MKKLLATSLLALGLMAGSGNAATILSLTGAEDPDFLGADFATEDGGPLPVGNGTPISVANDPLEGLLLDAKATIIFTFLGEEAGFNNLFNNVYLGDELLFANTATYGDTVARVLSPVAGFLPFKFVSDGSTDVTNGSVAALGALGSIGFYEIFDALTSTLDHRVFLALFNDTGGPDADYDDMIIRIEAIRFKDATTVVPLPAGLVLLLSGLMGLGFLGRSRSKVA